MIMGTKSAMVRVRVEPKLKRDAEKVLRELGLSSSEVIGLFYRQVVRRRALPFAVALDAAPESFAPEKRTAPPVPTGLAAVYKRLEELDEWRRFSYDLSQMKLRPTRKQRPSR